jgi:hypothetical protein
MALRDLFGVLECCGEWPPLVDYICGESSARRWKGHTDDQEIDWIMGLSGRRHGGLVRPCRRGRIGGQNARCAGALRALWLSREDVRLSS